jgi:hypothetical protein
LPGCDYSVAARAWRGEEFLLKFISRFLKDPKDYRGDYTSVFRAPSNDAKAIASLMTDEERANFNALLARLQQWHEGAAGNGSVKFHPEARALLWSSALAKIADHYQEIKQYERGYFFANAAWTLSRYPLFAFNAGLHSIQIGEIDRGKQFLNLFLDTYKSITTTPTFRLVDPDVNTDQLEDLAQKARSKLDELP